MANTSMDTDKVKIYGARVRVDSMNKVGCLCGPYQAGLGPGVMHRPCSLEGVCCTCTLQT